MIFIKRICFRQKAADLNELTGDSRIDVPKQAQIHDHPAIYQTAAQIALVLTKEMIAMPLISLTMMSLIQMLAKDDSAG